MTFDLPSLLAERAGQGYELQDQFLKPHLSRMLHVIGFDKVYTKGEGGYLWDAEGNRYADFLTGFGVFGMGRNHPVIRKALHDMLDAELADLVQFDCALLPGLLAERLLAMAPGLDRAYFSNGGTEAVETALKFARYATGKRRVLYCDHAFHGMTLGSLSVNGSPEFRRGFDPLLPDGRIPLGDLDALTRELRQGDVAALLVEPVQGKGVHISPPGFLPAAADLLHKHGALLICDEIQSGLGRTGRFFAYQHEDVQPDIVTVAKALSGGFIPIGHDSTFGHNAAAMTAGLAALSVIDDEHLMENAERSGQALMSALSEMVDTYELLGEVRGRGLMIGLEFGKPKSLKLRTGWNMLQTARHGLFAQMIVVFLFQRHRILTQVAADHDEVIKLLPTLTIGDTEIKLFCDAFADVMDDASRGSGLMWDFGRTLIKQAIKR
jgi:ornithine--oxo-acid transaminase